MAAANSQRVTRVADPAAQRDPAVEGAAAEHDAACGGVGEQPLAHRGDVVEGVLAVGVRAHHGRARSGGGDVGEAGLEGRALAAVDREGQHLGARGERQREAVGVRLSRPVVDDEQVPAGAGRAEVGEGLQERRSGPVGRDQDGGGHLVSP